MAYRITHREGYVEVEVSGSTSKDEIVRILLELNRQDPCKQIPDLWLFGPESQVPLADFIEIAMAVARLLPAGVRGAKSALVATDHFQEAQMLMYRLESAFLSFELRVFRSRAEALQWFGCPEPDPVG